MKWTGYLIAYIYELRKCEWKKKLRLISGTRHNYYADKSAAEYYMDTSPKWNKNSCIKISGANNG